MFSLVVFGLVLLACLSEGQKLKCNRYNNVWGNGGCLPSDDYNYQSMTYNCTSNVYSNLMTKHYYSTSDCSGTVTYSVTNDDIGVCRYIRNCDYVQFFDNCNYASGFFF